MIEVKKGTKSFYVGDVEEKPLAEMTFVPSDDNTIIIDHTYVSNELRGQGVAKLLLEELLEWAKKENIKVVPVCSYAKAQMEKNK